MPLLFRGRCGTDLGREQHSTGRGRGAHFEAQSKFSTVFFGRVGSLGGQHVRQDCSLIYVSWRDEERGTLEARIDFQGGRSRIINAAEIGETHLIVALACVLARRR